MQCRTLSVFAAFTLFFSLICGLKASAQYKNQITVELDNDMYINPNHDRYYSDASILTFIHASPVPDSSSRLAKRLMSYHVGQEIYNPSDSHIKRPSQFDRPFTGYLFMDVGYNWLYKNEDVLKFTAQVGTIGPAALGKQTQVNFHKVFGLHPVGSWDKYQLNTEPGINLDLDYKKLLYRTPGSWFDVTFNPEAELGTTFANANLGAMFRIGRLGRLFESASTNSLVNSGSAKPGHEFFLFTQPQVSYVAYNATIQGGLFRSDKGPYTFGIYHWLYIQQIGAQYTADRWSLAYIAYVRTREVKSTALGDQYGSVSLAYRFGNR